MQSKKLTWAEPVCAVFALIILLYTFLPLLLGFTPEQMTLWGQGFRSDRAILSDWYDRKTHGGTMAITYQDGTRVVMYSNDFRSSTKVYAPDGRRLRGAEAEDVLNQARQDARETIAALMGGGGG